jgi:hypothetical protein
MTARWAKVRQSRTDLQVWTLTHHTGARLAQVTVSPTRGEDPPLCEWAATWDRVDGFAGEGSVERFASDVEVLPHRRGVRAIRARLDAECAPFVSMDDPPSLPIDDKPSLSCRAARRIRLGGASRKRPPGFRMAETIGSMVMNSAAAAAQISASVRAAVQARATIRDKIESLANSLVFDARVMRARTIEFNAENSRTEPRAFARIVFDVRRESMAEALAFLREDSRVTRYAAEFDGDGRSTVTVDVNAKV